MKREHINPAISSSISLNVETLVEMLVSKRKEMHLSQRELAERLDMPQSTIGRIESGATIPSLETFVKIVDALELDIKLFEKRKKTQIK